MDGKKKSLPRAAVGARIREGLATLIAGHTREGLITGLTVAAIAFVLGARRLPFDVYPLGLAWLCASTQHTLLAAMGLLAAAFVMPFPPLLPICVTLGTLAARVAARVFIDLPSRIGGDGQKGEIWGHLRGRMFCEGLYLRMACVCVSVFSMSLYAIIAGGFRYYDLFGALFAMTTAPLCVFLFSGAFSGEADRLFAERGAEIYRWLAHVALSVAVCLALDGISPSGFAVDVGLAFILTLAVCRKDGFLSSLAVSALCGAILDPLIIPSLAATTFVAYCVQDSSHPLAAAVSCIAGTLCAIPLLGASAVGTVFLPFLAATVVYCAADKLTLRPVNTPTAPTPTVTHPALRHLREQTNAALRLADTLAELSAAFSALNKKQRKPSAADLRLLCDSCFDRLCPECAIRDECWEKRYHTMLDTTDLLVNSLASHEQLTVYDLPDTLSRCCVQKEALLEALNHGAAELLQNTMRAESTEIFSLDYGYSATLLRELCANCEATRAEDEKTAAAVSARLKALGYTATVSVTGERKKRICLDTLDPAPDSAQRGYITGQLARACGFPLSELAAEEDGSLHAIRAPSIEVTYGSNFSAHESVCGDVLSVFRDNENGYLCAILNDGMGSGKEAAFTAQLASLFLRKLLPSGVRPETALRMLNHFLRLGRNRGSAESSTTVDLLMVDLLQGRAIFLKSGAAPTYVKRDKNIFYLDASTAPLGILPELDAKQIDFEVRDGDIIVMVSDGVTDGEGECLWLLDYLDATTNDDPPTLAGHIVADAAERGNTDDLSAIVLRIKKHPF